MNNQVREYFARMRQQVVKPRVEKPVVEYYVYLDLLNEAANVKLKVSQDDLDFVKALRLASHTQNKGDMPKMSKAIMARYMLLHDSPLHHFAAEWDDQSNVMHIIERRPTHDNREVTHTVAIVNDVMRKDYNHVHKNRGLTAAPRPGEDREDADRRVAKWWMEECKDAILTPPQKAKKGKNFENLVPQVKIVRRGTNSVSFAFKKGGAYWGWTHVQDVPVDMEKFRKQVEEQGFDPKTHAPFLIRGDRGKWDDILYGDDSDNTQWDIRTKQPTPTVNKGTVNPAYNLAMDKSDPEFMNKYHEKPEFRKMVEEAVVKAVAHSAGRLITKSKGLIQIFVNWNDPTEVGDDSKYKIKIDPVLASGLGIDESLIRDFIQNTRLYIFRNSGHIDMDDEGKNSLYQMAVSGARSAIRDGFLRDKNRRAADIGGAGDAESKSNQGRAGGRRDLAIVGGEGGGSGGAGYDVTKMNGAGADKVGQFKQDRKGDYASSDGGYTPEDLLQAIKADMKSVYNDADTQYYVFKFAPLNPMIQKIADHIQDMDAVLPEVEERLKGLDGGDTGTDKYAPSPRPAGARMESVRHLSFLEYVRKRTGLNEMGVVWGNDKKSARVLKQGQTLKGGIQVSGAPWSAAGRGDPNNDVQIR